MARAEVRTCEVCGQKFDGYSTSRYCRECRKIREKEGRQRDRERFKAAAALARAKAAAKKLDEEEKRRKGTFIPNTAQCEGCAYWGKLGGGYAGLYCCHHLIRTGESRKRDGDRCLSYSTEGVAEEASAWPEYSNCESIYTGYTNT